MTPQVLARLSEVSCRASATRFSKQKIVLKIVTDNPLIEIDKSDQIMADEGHVPPGGTSDASNPDWNAQIAQEEQLRRQEAAIKAAEDGEKDYPSASVGSVADKGAPGRSLAQIVGASRRA